MTSQRPRRLQLQREILAVLDETTLAPVQGGDSDPGLQQAASSNCPTRQMNFSCLFQMSNRCQGH